MRSKPMTTKAPAERVLKDIRRATRRHFSAEDKIRIVLDGLRGSTIISMTYDTFPFWPFARVSTG